MAVISDDFARSLSVLHRAVETLMSDNRELKRELEEVKKQLAKTDDQSVQQHRRAVRAASLEQDQDRIRMLAATTTEPFDQELLRVSLPQEDIEVAPIQIDQNLYQGMLDAYRRGEPPAVQVTIERSEPPTPKKFNNLIPQKSIVPNDYERALMRIKKPKPDRGPGAISQLGSRWDIFNDPNSDF